MLNPQSSQGLINQLPPVLSYEDAVANYKQTQAPNQVNTPGTILDYKTALALYKQQQGAIPLEQPQVAGNFLQRLLGLAQGGQTGPRITPGSSRADEAAIKVQQLPEDLRQPIQQAAQKYHLDPQLLAAISQVETGQRNIPQTGSGLGQGYFQIDAGAHPEVTPKQAYDPSYAADYAASLLADRLKKYGNLPDAIKAYNGNPHTPATAPYLQKVLQVLQTTKFQ